MNRKRKENFQMLPKELHQLKYKAISLPQGSVHLVKKTHERKSSTCYLLIPKDVTSSSPVPLKSRRYPSHIFLQDNFRPHAERVAMDCLTASQTLPWPVRSKDLSPIEHVWDMMGRRLHQPGNVDDLARPLEQIWLQIPGRPSKYFYPSMSRRLAACIQARGGSTPY
ncbi:transposable element Tcb1 transposase [Trichonephila clavipes]|uniref:Transposable element Tcb1 transposase n=1 Tax=Trichonephila clavipes TaxID=2585209 RepID=A0A8X6VUV6_TRICX|nr:transposable element Tcb1 transposase [Trichonephila clavipes]